jgi:hypothetical protein
VLHLLGFEPLHTTIPGTSSKTVYVKIIAPKGCNESILSLTALATDWSTNLRNSDTVDIIDICGPLGLSSEAVPATKSSKGPKSKKRGRESN